MDESGLVRARLLFLHGSACLVELAGWWNRIIYTNQKKKCQQPLIALARDTVFCRRIYGRQTRSCKWLVLFDMASGETSSLNVSLLVLTSLLASHCCPVFCSFVVLRSN